MDTLIAAGALLGAAACSWAISASSLSFFTGFLVRFALSLVTTVFVPFRIASSVVAVCGIVNPLWWTIGRTCAPYWPVIAAAALFLLVVSGYVVEVCILRPLVACLC